MLFSMEIIIRLVLSSVAVFVTAYILPGVHVDGLVTILAVAVVLGAINAVIKPIITIITLPLTIVTLGIFYLVINAAMVLLAAAVVPEFKVDGFWWALAFSIVLSLVSSVLNRIQRPAE